MITSTSEKPENVKRVHQIRIDLVTLCTDKYVQLKLVMLFRSLSNTIIRFCAAVLLTLKQKETNHILRPPDIPF